MKSPVGLEKNVSLALLCTVLGLFTANVSPAVAATNDSTDAAAANRLSALEVLAPEASVKESEPSDRTTQITALAADAATTTSATPAIADATLQAQALSPSDDSPGMIDVATLDPENPEAASDGMAQVTSVSQLSDVQPTDWAFQSLQSLVERYGCIAGYPDGTYRGNRALTRYEFAAGVNSCLDRINELIQAGTDELVQKEDLATLQRLQEEFSAELATIRGRVDSLEARTAELEANQFSTTTKLFGQAIFGIQGRTDNTADFFPVDGVKDTEDPATNINFINNVQLSLFTQLSNRSILLTGLAAGNGSTAPRLSNDTRLGYELDSDNQFLISDLSFRHLIGNNLAVVAGPVGVNAVNVFRGANRVESSGQGPISAFAQRNPIISIGNGTGGAGFDWQVSPRISLQGVYSASDPADPNDAGLFGSRRSATTAGAQLTVSPTDTIDLALHYLNSYNPSGSNFAGSLGLGIGDDQVTIGSGLKTDAFGATVAWRATPGITVGGWGGFTNSRIPNRDGNVETTNWMAFLNFPDLFGEGNLGGIYVGQPPKITESDLPAGQNIPNLLAGGAGTEGDQPGTTTHLEVFYRYRVSDNITITPGVIVLFNPGNAPESDTVGIGALRTTFTF
ncbi:iron uptake porin [Trichocoleus sp. FACHB-262]|uniref:iron uptake porin n=1 Tax=Trichocoleus sp. FACHB-262 TaxID=2692869 RepID=UPI0016871CD9|nr:iron uptake porin [Trichocoleus sp. FACHB-262]MBD2119632.1 carbohydrate porin [Trichocoleus sp. FACHB-262]